MTQVYFCNSFACIRIDLEDRSLIVDICIDKLLSIFLSPFNLIEKMKSCTSLIDNFDCF